MKTLARSTIGPKWLRLVRLRRPSKKGVQSATGGGRAELIDCKKNKKFGTEREDNQASDGGEPFVDSLERKKFVIGRRGGEDKRASTGGEDVFNLIHAEGDSIHSDGDKSGGEESAGTVGALVDLGPQKSTGGAALRPEYFGRRKKFARRKRVAGDPALKPEYFGRRKKFACRKRVTCDPVLKAQFNSRIDQFADGVSFGDALRTFCGGNDLLDFAQYLNKVYDTPFTVDYKWDMTCTEGTNYVRILNHNPAAKDWRVVVPRTKKLLKSGKAMVAASVKGFEICFKKIKP